MRRRPLLLGLPLLPGLAAAQAPDPGSRQAGAPIKLIVPFTQGGTADTVARIVAPALANALGQPILVENRPGSGGTQGAMTLAQAPPDGLTLGISTTTAFGTAPLMVDAPDYHAERDFTHVAMIAETPSVLVVRADSRFRSFADYMRAAGSWVRGLTYGSPGIGTLQHLQAESLAQASGARLTHVPYRGTQAVLRDLQANAMDSAFLPLAGTAPKLQSGELRALAVSSAEPVPALPGVPTFAAVGYPALTAAAWSGLSGPRGLSPARVARLNAEVNRIIADPAIVRRLAEVGLTPPTTPMDAAGYQALIARFGIAWGPMVKAAGLRGDAGGRAE
jgi:tripartite-type tricarboxylate transporter receptor subunit TctC